MGIATDAVETADVRPDGVADDALSADEAQWREFRTERESALRRPHDWLSVTGLFWVGGTPAAIGPVPGEWWEVDGVLHVRPDGAVPLVLLARDTAPEGELTGEVTLAVDEAGAVPFATYGDDVRVEVLRRGGYYALRLRDPAAPARATFDGVPTWAFDPAWRLEVRLEPYDEPRTVVVGSAAPGLSQRASAVGEVVLTRDGVEHRLVATGRHGSWSVAFSDATSGVESSAWRAVPVLGSPTDGVGVIDLNRAVSYPYAFSDFGTCPAPVAGNALPFAVTAGEKAPAGRTGVPPVSGGPTALPGPQRLP